MWILMLFLLLFICVINKYEGFQDNVEDYKLLFNPFDDYHKYFKELKKQKYRKHTPYRTEYANLNDSLLFNPYKDYDKNNKVEKKNNVMYWKEQQHQEECDRCNYINETKHRSVKCAVKCV